jgi:hypothetical protein
MVITSIVAVACWILCLKFVKTEKSKDIIIRTIGLLLFVAIMTNRFSQVFRYGTVRWYCIIPDSFCGMTSLVLSLGMLLGKKDNAVLHFSWLLGIFGGISTVVYPTFVSQDASFFYIPTISGLAHHSFAAFAVIMLFTFGYIDITYKKWHYVMFGLTSYMTVGAFLMAVFPIDDAFHIVEPLLEGTPLTAWVMGPIYVFAHGLIFLIVEIVKRHKKSKAEAKETKETVTV